MAASSRSHASAHAALSTRLLETSLAAPQVVAHRVQRLMLAGPLPSARDRAEFTGMGLEKLVAFQQSWAAMALQAIQWQQQALAQLWGLALAGPVAGAATALAPGRLAADPALAFTRLLHAGLGPVHAKATGNARRLARVGSRRR